MISFVINILKFLKAMFVGIKNDKDFRVLLFLLLSLLIGSSIFYSEYEGWSLVDALYFSVMTMSTVGYGDLVPTNDISKIFTIIFTFLSVGIFVSLNTKIVLIFISPKKRSFLHRKEKITEDHL